MSTTAWWVLAALVFPGGALVWRLVRRYRQPMTTDFDAFVGVVTAEQAARLALEAENADLKRQLEECQGGGPNPPEPTPGARAGFGYYQQGTDLEAIYAPQEERWGREIDRVLCFTPNATSWDTLVIPGWWSEDFGTPASRWASDYGTVVSLQLVPQGETVTTATSSEVYQAYKKIGQALVACGLARSILRIGWESQGTWYPWSSVTAPEAYADRFRDAVNGARQAAGEEFLIDWNIAGGKNVDLRAFPGGVYVDVVSIDLYDAPGLELAQQAAAMDECRSIAHTHGAEWAIAEWGLWGKEHTAYTQQMTDYISEHAPLYQAYFDVSSSSDHRLSLYPASEAIYAEWAPTAP